MRDKTSPRESIMTTDISTRRTSFSSVGRSRSFTCWLTSALSVLAALALSGCGGGEDAPAAANPPASSADLDWSNVTLKGTFPTFTFQHPTLGTVTVVYSTNTEEFGITNLWAASESLRLGYSGGESVVISWTNAITSAELLMWDVDYSGAGGSTEAVQIVASATFNPVSLHATDSWDAATHTLSGGTTLNAQDDPTNFSVIRFSSAAGFNAMTLNWNMVGGIGTGSLGIGDLRNIVLR